MTADADRIRQLIESLPTDLYIDGHWWPASTGDRFEVRNPATGETIKIPAKTVVKARIAKQLKDAVLPRK